ncbi:MAG: RrF2 family transcriptional regulator [Wenzhouxiangella sp.]
MRLTQYTDYSVRVLIYIGLNPDLRCTIGEIAESYGISKNHLMKVVQQLAAAGFVRSIRGAGGGLTLGMPPDQISLGAVVREMEPDFGMVECLRPDNSCVITPACKLPQILRRAADAFLAELEAHTLADLLSTRQRPALRRLLHVQ